MNTNTTNDNTCNAAQYGEIKCTNCGTVVHAVDAVCPKCGGDKIDLRNTEKEQIESNVILLEREQYVFAEGLPEWSIEPPQIVIRRIVRK